MAIVLFDTNILIDHTLGIWEASRELAGYDNAAISTINWIEVTCALTEAGRAQFERDLADAGIVILQTTLEIMRSAAEIRSGRNLTVGMRAPKLPDCIIWATAEVEGRTIVTRHPDDFGGIANPGVRVPYKNTNGVISDVQPLLSNSLG